MDAWMLECQNADKNLNPASLVVSLTGERVGMRPN
jgi:hypothetical protein